MKFEFSMHPKFSRPVRLQGVRFSKKIAPQLRKRVLLRLGKLKRLTKATRALLQKTGVPIDPVSVSSTKSWPRQDLLPNELTFRRFIQNLFYKKPLPSITYPQNNDVGIGQSRTENVPVIASLPVSATPIASSAIVPMQARPVIMITPQKIKKGKSTPASRKINSIIQSGKDNFPAISAEQQSQLNDGVIRLASSNQKNLKKAIDEVSKGSSNQKDFIEFANFSKQIMSDAGFKLKKKSSLLQTMRGLLSVSKIAAKVVNEEESPLGGGLSNAPPLENTIVSSTEPEKNSVPQPEFGVPPPVSSGDGSSARNGNSASDGMTNFQIDNVLAHYKPIFKGCFMRDELLRERIPLGKSAYIVNTDTSDKDGSHWQAIYSDPTHEKTIEFYDSFGKEPHADIKKWMKREIFRLKLPYYIKFKVNRMPSQRINSGNCGMLASLFLSNRLGGMSWKRATNFKPLEAEKLARQSKMVLRKFKFI